MSHDIPSALRLALPSWAIIDGVYRYALGRGTGVPTVAWVMLNPSTADALRDDPTIRKVKKFSRILTGDETTRIIVVNLYAYRSTNPKGLHTAPRGVDIIGPMNVVHMGDALHHAHHIVAAWGANKGPFMGAAIASFNRLALRGGRVPACLGRTADGSPRHPLMLPYSTPFEDFNVAHHDFPPAVPDDIPRDVSR